MKKIEEDFLNNNIIKTESSFSDIKESIYLNNYISKKKTSLKLAIKISSFILAFFSLIAIIAIGVDAKEYKDAIEFFEVNQLSNEGLTRREIKLVYRDIKTNTFKYSKTGEVINNSLTFKIPGYEISPIDPKIQDPEYMWEYWNKILSGKQLKGSGYKIIYKEAHWENGERIPFENKLIKYEDNEIIWENDIKEYNIEKFRIYDNIIFAFPYSVHTNDYYKKYYADYKEGDYSIIGNLLFIDTESGNIIKQIEYNNANEYLIGSEESKNVVKNDDGTYTLISIIRTDDHKMYLTLMTFDINAKIISTFKKEINYHIDKIIKYNDGFLILSGRQLIIKIDKYGNKLEEITYENDKYVYFINDIIEYNGKIYLSTDYVDKEKNKSQDYRGNDIYSETYYIWKYAKENQLLGWDSNLTDIFRKEFHAALLVCEKDDGTPKEFYTIRGAIGDDLYLNEEGKLVWEVDNISCVLFSACTSSFSFGGTCDAYEYIFNVEGKLENIIDINEEKILRML